MQIYNCKTLYPQIANTKTVRNNFPPDKPSALQTPMLSVSIEYSANSSSHCSITRQNGTSLNQFPHFPKEPN